MPRKFKPPRMAITANTSKDNADKLSSAVYSMDKKKKKNGSGAVSSDSSSSSIVKSTAAADNNETPTTNKKSKKSLSSSTTTTTTTKKRKRSLSKFKAPAMNSKTKQELLSEVSKSSKAASSSSSKSASDATTRKQYFACMWTKLSNKKHKTYSDGFFIVEGNKFFLLDDKAKQIAKDVKGGGPKKCKTGDAYIIQNKEIELMNEIPPEDYESGRCFLNQSAPSKPPKKVKKKKSTKPFNPHQSVDLSQVQVREEKIHTAPEGCLLLNPDHPERDENGTLIHDVWVDGFLSRILHPHQEDGIRFLYECACGMKEYAGQGAVLADEMGLGKTLQSIALFYTLLQRGPYGKPLIKKAVIVTNSSLVGNWKNEVKKWLGNSRCKPLIVAAKSHKQDPEDTINSFRTAHHPLLIISYGLAMKYATLINKAKPGLLICDEGHKLKNSEIKVVKALKRITTPRRFILTGTPIQNNLQEFYSIIDFINPNVFGGDAGQFKHLFDNPISKAREPNASDQEKAMGLARARELNRIVSQFILRRTSKIISKHLPPKTEMIVFCKMSNLQRALYQKFLKSRFVFSILSAMDRSNALSCIQTLKKLLAHPNMIKFDTGDSKNDEDSEEEEEEESMSSGHISLKAIGAKRSIFPPDYDFDGVDPEFSGKLCLLVSMLKKMHEIGDNVVVVSYFTSILDLVQRVLDNLNFTYCRMDGKTSQNKRTEIVERFNSKHNTSFCFLLSSKTGGAGHNLIGANRLIIFDCDWNPANDAQAMARVWRHGQKKDVFIYRFIAAGTVEEKILQRQMVKTGLSKMTVDEKSNSAAFSKEFLRELFCFTDDDFCETFEKEAEDNPNFLKHLKQTDSILYQSGKETDLLTYVKVSSEGDYEENLAVEEDDEEDNGIVTIKAQNGGEERQEEEEDDEEEDPRPKKRRKTSK